jgi:hypothetical protein
LVKADQIHAEFYRDAGLKQIVWDRMLKLMRSSLLFESERLRDHNNGVV